MMWPPLAMCLLLGCTGAVEPSAALACPVGQVRWFYSARDVQGRWTANLTGCASQAVVDSLMALCMAGVCGPPS